MQNETHSFEIEKVSGSNCHSLSLVKVMFNNANQLDTTNNYYINVSYVKQEKHLYELTESVHINEGGIHFPFSLFQNS